MIIKDLWDTKGWKLTDKKNEDRKYLICRKKAVRQDMVKSENSRGQMNSK